MGAVEIIPDPTRAIDTFSLSPASLAVAIAGVATAILSACLAGAFVDSRLRFVARQGGHAARDDKGDQRGNDQHRA